VFLALAAAVSVVGTVVLWARHRHTDSPDASIEAFNNKMRALSDDGPRGPVRDDERQER